MIVLRDVSFSYEGSETDEGLRRINLNIPQGQVVVLCGESGCGKTTLTRLINGLIPHYCQGDLTGKVLVQGADISAQPVQETARSIGSVFQNPRSQFFTVDTASELAFGCENMEWPAEAIEERVQKIAEEFRLSPLLERNLFALSGGEKQRIACASVSAPDPEILVLDEPSSNLDITSMGELADFISAWKRTGKTIIIAEHRLRYVLPLADRILYMRSGEIVLDLPTTDFIRHGTDEITSMGLRPIAPIHFAETAASSNSKIEIEDAKCFRGKKLAVHIDRLTLPTGSIIAVLGDNGAGKTTFARCFCGLEKKARGSYRFHGKNLRAKQRRANCFIVMQDVSHQLFTESVMDELRISFPRKLSESEIAQKTQEILESLHLLELQERHPQSLSGGEKQRVAIACAIASGKQILFYDEPTSGLDLRHMEEVSRNLKHLQTLGTTQFVITHDPDLVAHCCDYVVFMQAGEVVWDAPVDCQSIQKLKSYFYV